MFKSMIKLLKLPPLAKTVPGELILDAVRIAPTPLTHVTYKHITKDSVRREIVLKMRKEEPMDGEKNVDIDTLVTKEDMFPDKNTPKRLFDGVPFSELACCNIRSSRNNTIFSLTEYTGIVKFIHTCGLEGFKNAKKGTNIAAQSTAIAFGKKVLQRGFKTVRVTVRGLGPGRMSSIKGLEMSGLNIVSVTDTTPVTWTPLRPRKIRRL